MGPPSSRGRVRRGPGDPGAGGGGAAGGGAGRARPPGAQRAAHRAQRAAGARARTLRAQTRGTSHTSKRKVFNQLFCLPHERCTGFLETFCRVIDSFIFIYFT